MAALVTKPIRIYEDDHAPLRLIAEAEGRAPADVMHAALEEYLSNHRESLAEMFRTAQQAIAAGDLDALTALASHPAKRRARDAVARHAQL